jgi:hypothetical protein
MPGRCRRAKPAKKKKPKAEKPAAEPGPEPEAEIRREEWETEEYGEESY